MTDLVDQLQTLNLSATELKNAGLDDALINEWLNFVQNFITVATGADDNSEQVNNNTQAIAVNAQGIADNVTNITTNSSNISSLSTSLTNHTSSNSQHGVAGNNVGTENYAQSSTGGVVFIMSLVADAVDSTATVTEPDALDAPGTYSNIQIQGIVDLVNEIKSDHNQLVTDVNSAIAQLNELIANSKTSRQMSAT